MTVVYGTPQMHMPDGGHNWIAPPGVDQQDWEQVLHAHLDDLQHDPTGICRVRDRQHRTLHRPLGSSIGQADAAWGLAALEAPRRPARPA